MIIMVKKTKIEARSRQVTVTFKPSVYKSMQKIAYIYQCSTNNVLNIAVEEYAKAHQDIVNEYDKTEGEVQNE